MEPEGTCACGQTVRNVFTVGGIVRQLETTPHPDGNHVLEQVLQPLTGPGPVPRARVLSGLQMPAPDGAGYRIHRCPPPPRPGPPCSVCGLTMNRELAALEKWATHPCCDPEFLRLLGHNAARRAARTDRTRRRRT
jgi:hypothetical protein